MSSFYSYEKLNTNFVRYYRSKTEPWSLIPKWLYKIAASALEDHPEWYHGRQWTYPWFPGVPFTSSSHNVLSKLLAGFRESHDQQWERHVKTRTLTKWALSQNLIFCTQTDTRTDTRTDVLRRGTCGVDLLFIQCNPTSWFSNPTNPEPLPHTYQMDRMQTIETKCTLTQPYNVSQVRADRRTHRRTDRLIPVYPRKHLFCGGLIISINPRKRKLGKPRIEPATHCSQVLCTTRLWCYHLSHMLSAKVMLSIWTSRWFSGVVQS